MREMKMIAGMSAAVLAVAVVISAARPAAEQTITADELAELTAIRPVPGKNGLYVIPGYDGGVTGGNVAVRVTNDGVIIVDNKFPHSFRMIMSEVRKVTSLPIKYVLDTHHHGDHAGSNADFMAVGEVISHKNARRNMLRNNQPGAPRIVFSDETSVFLGGVEARAHHFGRGHTNGDAVIYFPELRTIHTGDLFIWGQRSDGSTLAPFMDYNNGRERPGLDVHAGRRAGARLRYRDSGPRPGPLEGRGAHLPRPDADVAGSHAGGGRGGRQPRRRAGPGADRRSRLAVPSGGAAGALRRGVRGPVGCSNGGGG